MKSLFNLLLILSMFFVAEEHEIKMLNFSESGPMVFEPGFLRVEPVSYTHLTLPTKQAV